MKKTVSVRVIAMTGEQLAGVAYSAISANYQLSIVTSLKERHDYFIFERHCSLLTSRGWIVGLCRVMCVPE